MCHSSFGEGFGCHQVSIIEPRVSLLWNCCQVIAASIHDGTSKLRGKSTLIFHCTAPQRYNLHSICSLCRGIECYINQDGNLKKTWMLLFNIPRKLALAVHVTQKNDKNQGNRTQIEQFYKTNSFQRGPRSSVLFSNPKWLYSCERAFPLLKSLETCALCSVCPKTSHYCACSPVRSCMLT